MQEEVVLRRDVLVERGLAALIAVPAFCCMTVVVYLAFGAARLEFTYSVCNSDKKPSTDMPLVAGYYAEMYSLGWAGPVIGGVWLLGLLRRKTCTIASLICHLAFVVAFTTIWLVLTLLVFYVLNQTFWAS